MHGAAALRLLLAPRPALDTDRTILIHQVEASRARQEAEVVLIGDSSCLMDISARQLGQGLGRPVLKLGTLSYLDLNAYALLVREYARANPGRLREVVLLMHPEALRRASPEPYYVQTLQALLNHEMAQTDHSMHEAVAGILGLSRFRDCCPRAPAACAAGRRVRALLWVQPEPGKLFNPPRRKFNRTGREALWRQRGIPPGRTAGTREPRL